jgi:hypothetical protein
MDIRARREFQGEVLRAWNARYGQCLAPSGCDEPPIAAHTIQKSGALRLLETKGHVVMLRMRHAPLPKPPKVSFESVGTSKASVFTGLCSQHDASLFAPVDSVVLPTTQDELFLQAYRAVLGEVHSCNEIATKLQHGYNEEIARGFSHPDNISPRGLYATQRMVIAYETWLYKEILDDALRRRDFSMLEHDVVPLGPTGPCVAASALFDLPEHNAQQESVRVAFTVLPTPAGETFAFFSYTPDDTAPARRLLERMLGAEPPHRTREVSRVILERCQNFALAPAAFDRFSDAKRATVRDFFLRTLLEDAPAEFDHPHLDLFRGDK